MTMSLLGFVISVVRRRCAALVWERSSRLRQDPDGPDHMVVVDIDKFTGRGLQ